MGLFGLDPQQFLALNPGLDCNNLVDMQTICVERDSSMVGYNPPCTRTHRVEGQENCNYLRSLALVKTQDSYQPLSWLDFFRLNPGLVCDRLTPPVGGALVGTEVRGQRWLK